jgi:hypothetical protein
LQVIEIASYEWFNRLNLKRFFETVVVQQVPNSGVLRLSYSPTPFTAMKNILLLLVCSLAMLATQANAQSKPQSPPATTTATVNGKTITINYSQPSVKGRKIWGGLVPYGEVWRTGANESSTFEVSADVTVQGKTLPKGKYALFTIPGEKEWTIIFNKTIAWGAYSYKPSEDVLRVTAVPAAAAKAFEQFTIQASDKGVVSLSWDQLTVNFQVQ